MATFSGGTSPAALKALAPSINNLAAARNARSQSISGLMNTIGAGLERNKKQKQVKEKNEIAMGVATGLLNDPSFRKSVPGITDPASLIKLTGADEVIKFGREQQKINLVTKEANANIGLIKARMDDFERQKEEREKEKESSKAFQVLYPKTINLKPGADTKDIFKDPSFQNLTPEHAKIVFDNVLSQTGLSSQVLMAELEKAKMELGATEKIIESGELLSEVNAGIATGAIKNIDEVTNLDKFPVEQQGEILSALEKKNPTAPKAIPIPNPNNPEEILGYAIPTGNGNVRIMESAESGGGLGRTAQDAANALKLRLDAGKISQEEFQKGMDTIRTQASFVTDPETGLGVDPTKMGDPPVTDPEAPDTPAPTKNALDIAESLSNLSTIISQKGDLYMGELEKALSAYRSRNTGLSEDDISEIKNLLVQESKDRKAQRRLMAEQKERDTIEYETRYNIDETGRGPIYFEGM
tara:strand:+ start:1524 stop:2933 length:1410 start_codon:yes stop_codon:yes gene_type:complete